MSEALKAGDKVKSGGDGKVTGVVLATNTGNDGYAQIWVRSDLGGRALSYGANSWTLIPAPQWEVGKKYTSAADDHKVVYHVVDVGDFGYPVLAWKSLISSTWVVRGASDKTPEHYKLLSE